jgi:hypothetical protein
LDDLHESSAMVKIIGTCFTYLERFVIRRCDGDRDETLPNRFQHLPNCIAPSRAFELLSQFCGDMNLERNLCAWK